MAKRVRFLVKMANAYGHRTAAVYLGKNAEDALAKAKSDPQNAVFDQFNAVPHRFQ